jgi:Skp family chaperone for outer membrane proteins
VEAQAARLRQELETMAGQRFRLEDSLLAEIRIEIAALAQDQKIDAVLTRVLASTTAVDLTQAVIARIRRP